MRNRSLASVSLLVILAAAGCRIAPDPTKNQCHASSDCGAGRSCVAGVCRVLGTAGVRVSPTTRLQTSEYGASAHFTVALSDEPTDVVRIPVASDTPAEGVAAPAELIFTPANWSSEQTVTVSGVDDHVIDGDRAYQVTLGPIASNDARYRALTVPPLQLTNIDDDFAGVAVDAPATLVTTELGGQASFTVALRAQPTHDVTVHLSSSRPSEGTVAPEALVFHPGDWSTPQTVTVTGVPDSIVDGDQAYQVELGPFDSADARYGAATAAPLAAVNVDMDHAGIAVVAGGAPLTTSEAGASASFTVVLRSQPSSNVTLALHSSKTAEGTVSPAELVFHAADWSQPQTVTVHGVDDTVADGDQAYAIVFDPARSQDPRYDGLTPAALDAVNRDNEVAGFVVTPRSLTTTEQLGADVSFTVALTAPPTETVVIPVAWDATGHGVVTPSSLSFTAANWSSPQTVTVSPRYDHVALGDRTYVVRLLPPTSGGLYTTLDPDDVTVLIKDTDHVGLELNPLLVGAIIDENSGGEVQFGADTYPQGKTVLRLRSDNPAVGVMSTAIDDPSNLAEIVYDADEAHSGESIYVWAVGDHHVDGDRTFHLTLEVLSSEDPAYAGLPPVQLTLVKHETDVAGLVVTAPSPLRTAPGAPAQLKVKLRAQPYQPVTFTVDTDAPGVAAAAPATVTFTPDGWQDEQTITLSSVAATAQAYQVRLGELQCADPAFAGVRTAPLAASNAASP